MSFIELVHIFSEKTDITVKNIAIVHLFTCHPLNILVRRFQQWLKGEHMLVVYLSINLNDKYLKSESLEKIIIYSADIYVITVSFIAVRPFGSLHLRNKRSKNDCTSRSCESRIETSS